MWFLAIAAGIVILIVALTQAERMRRAGHPALAGFIESVFLYVFGACIFAALGLAAHDTASTLAWVVLIYAAAMVITRIDGRLAERARLAGYPALVKFVMSARLPVSSAALWVALGLAFHHVDWIVAALLPVVYAAIAIGRSLRAKWARPPAERP